MKCTDKQNILDDLEEFKALEKDWDEDINYNTGEIITFGEPINRDVINLVKSTVEKLSDLDCDGWVVWPETNGEVQLDFTKGRMKLTGIILVGPNSITRILHLIGDDDNPKTIKDCLKRKPTEKDIKEVILGAQDLYEEIKKNEKQRSSKDIKNDIQR